MIGATVASSVGGQTYSEYRPAQRLATLVSAVWIQRVSPIAGPYRHRNIPNGSVEVVCRVGSVPRIIGPMTRPMVDVLAPGTTEVGVRFYPGTAVSVLGGGLPELVDAALDADDLWGRAAIEVGERVAGSASADEGVCLLQEFLVGRLAGLAGPDSLVVAALRRMAWSSADVSSIRLSLNISERQFRRRCESAVGISPKALQRMLRFQGFVALAQSAVARGRKPASAGLPVVAAEAGYADQSHLTRECMRLTGVPPRVFLRETERQCGRGHDHAVPFARVPQPRADSESAAV
jgi:AraC-like DNA-binding protein